MIRKFGSIKRKGGTFMGGKAWLHFKTITTHKLLVMRYCFQVGLYKQGILHDLSKYSPTEFSVGVKYYLGDESPNNAERMDKGYSSAWLHHKGRNKHHYEYWIDYSLDGAYPLAGMKMPLCYVVEMVIDRICASKVYYGKEYNQTLPWKYYARGRKRMIVHPETQALLEKLLKMLYKKGEKKTFWYIKYVLLPKGEY